jgi:hypothetical protein
MLYVGVDAHKAHSQMTVMDQTGKILKRRRVASSREGVLEALEPHRADGGEPMKAVLEAGYGWGAIYDWLEEVADEVILAHPLKVRAIAEARIKTDKLDSEMLAHLLRADLIPEAYAPSKETRATKRVLRQRMFLVRLQTMVKNRVWALLWQHDRATPSERPFRQEGSHMAQGADRTARARWEAASGGGGIGRDFKGEDPFHREPHRRTSGGGRGSRVAEEPAGGWGVLLGFDPPRGRRDGALPKLQEVRLLHGASALHLRLW